MRVVLANAGLGGGVGPVLPGDEGGGERLGLRERKKRATRQALHSAALRLVAEHGIDAVTIEDIASAADVSPRTFFNYFGSKEDVIVNPDPERVDRLGALLAGQGPDEPMFAGVENALIAVLSEVTDQRDEWLLRLRLVREIPSLTPRYLAALNAMEQEIVQHVAQRTGRDPRSDIYPAIVASAAMAALRAAITRWSNGDGQGSLPHFTHEAFAVLRAGIE